MRKLIKEVVSDGIECPYTKQLAEDDAREIQQAQGKMSYHLEAYRRTRIEEEKKNNHRRIASEWASIAIALRAQAATHDRA